MNGLINSRWGRLIKGCRILCPDVWWEAFHQARPALAQPKNALPKSDLPGLVYRRRGNGGSWIVVVFVPTHLRSLLVNSKGKPLARLERSTGTSDLKLAKARYAEIRTALQREIEQRSGSPLPSAEAGPHRLGPGGRGHRH